MIWALLIHNRLKFIFLLFVRQLNKKHRIYIYLPFILSRNIIKKTQKSLLPIITILMYLYMVYILMYINIILI